MMRNYPSRLKGILLGRVHSTPVFLRWWAAVSALLCTWGLVGSLFVRGATRSEYFSNKVSFQKTPLLFEGIWILRWLSCMGYFCYRKKVPTPHKRGLSLSMSRITSSSDVDRRKIAITDPIASVS
jgi:hypothetical protein